ncbi:DUF983 domain-containing protein [Roseivirga sp. BDSF3-8]|uniref:DUF983 domain-containing protein n=1 Tax=Roseivirga sp. BDSF3-8 TaxID=3241598 RepID=UPI003531E7A5
MAKRSKLLAIAGGKCPRCREGNMFKNSLLHVTKFDKMHKECPNCGLVFEREPGFFFGAMYVSYAFTMGILLTTAFVLYNFFDDPELIVYVLTVPAIVILLLPPIFRFSRVLYLHAFGGVSYDPKYSN